MNILHHTCTPGQFCGLCLHNVKAGGSPNYPSNIAKPPVRANVIMPITPKTECAHISGTPAVFGVRKWFKCNGGYGSTVQDERAGHVCRCNSIKAPNLWAVGGQCGKSCPGYTTTLPEGKEREVPAVQRLEVRKKLNQFTWACGLTTVPSRRKTTLPRTLLSLSKAGFPAPRLFVDGDVDGKGWVEEFGLDVTARGGDPVRTFGNWVCAAAELYARNPDADRYGLFQDDFVTCRNLREYLDQYEFPKNGYWNLYMFPKNAQLAEGRKGWYESNQRGLGAVALVFDRVNLLRVLQSDHMAGRPMNKERGHKAVDGGIVTAMVKAGGKEYVHNPSLIQHIGHASSMGNRRQPDAPGFVGEDFDARELLERAETEK